MFGDARLPERFWNKVSPEPNTGCWLWAGCTKPKGYAKMGRGGKNGGTVYAHRLAYVELVGDVPSDMELDHVCATRSCVNPQHLRLATSSQNNANMRARAGSSRFKGVSWHQASGKWWAQSKVRGVHHNLGLHDTEAEAARAYDTFVRREFGEFARTNEAMGLFGGVQ